MSSVRYCFRKYGKDFVKMETKLTRQTKQMHEMQIELQRLATTSQAVAEEEACAALTTIDMTNVPEEKKTKLNNRDTEKYWPESIQEDRVDRKSFAEFLEQIETYLSVLAPGLLVRCLLEWTVSLHVWWSLHPLFLFLYLLYN